MTRSKGNARSAWGRVAAGLLMFTIGCTKGAGVTKVPIGSEIDLTRRDGGVIHGRLDGVERGMAVLRVGARERRVPTDEIIFVRVVPAVADGTVAADAALPPAATFREYTIPRGTRVIARLDTRVASDTSRAEDPVDATVVTPVVVDRREVLAVGALVKGVVSHAQPSGKVSGRATLGLRFTTLTAFGEDYAIAARISAEARATKQRDAQTIGIPAVGGAIVGGWLGGKKGAAIGAIIGGGAGTGVVLTTTGADIRWPRGTSVSLALETDVDVRVPIRRLPPAETRPFGMGRHLDSRQRTSRDITRP